MVAYSFKARFAEPILTNQKLQTIRAVGKRRHAGAGSLLQLYTGMRTKQCKLVATRRCASVHQIELMILPSEKRVAARVDGRALSRLINDSEPDAGINQQTARRLGLER